MTAVDLYLALGVATGISVLVSLSARWQARMIRNATVLLSYVLFVALFFVDPWWRILAVWCLAGLVTGLICFMIDRSWNRQARESQADYSPLALWQLIPLGLLGWPDMLPHMLEMAAQDFRVFRHLPYRNDLRD
jgi:hypothetical protein